MDATGWIIHCGDGWVDRIDGAAAVFGATMPARAYACSCTPPAGPTEYESTPSGSSSTVLHFYCSGASSPVHACIITAHLAGHRDRCARDHLLRACTLLDFWCLPDRLVPWNSRYHQLKII